MVAEYAGRVSHDQRFTRGNPCPICEGSYSDPRGHGIRCYGYLGEGQAEGFVFCTNDSYAGGLPKRDNGCYKHKLAGACWCGSEHTAANRVEPLPRRASNAPVKISRTHQKYPTIATHEYRDADGALRFRVARFWSGKEPPVWLASVPKCMPQRPDGAGDFLDGLDGMGYTGLYRLPELLTAAVRKPVYIVGGEKCADAIVAAGGVATCNAGGEGPGKWRAEYNAPFTGRTVVILADADETGRAHAQAIADSLAGVASSVRALELEGAHDVADWLADGHTLLELLEIIVCLPLAQNSNPGSASSTGGTEVSQEAYQQERDARKMAETSLASLRREQAMTSRILALPKEQLSAPLKPAAIAVREVLSQPKARDAQGMELVYRRAISQRCGVSDETAGEYLRKLAQAGVIRREVRKSFDNTEIHISEGPLFDAPEQIAPTPTVWGGKRTKKGCPHCQSIDIVPTSYGCNNCGAHMHPDELIDVVVEEEAQDGVQDTPLPPDTIVPDLAPDVDGEVFACPDCGRGGDMLKDYGDGWPRCRACDVPAERQVS